jgi:hypothetical protein
LALTDAIGAYSDCEEEFQKALEDSVGSRVLMPTYEAAHLFQMRLHQYRALLRKESRRMYEKTDPQYDKSTYDCLMVKKPVQSAEGDGWWIYIKRHGQEIIASETLSELDE